MSASISGTPFDDTFASIARAMGLGSLPESSPSQRARIVWERSGALDPQLGGFRAAGEKRIGKLAHPWTAIVYGDSDAHVCDLVAQLIGHLERIIGKACPAVPEQGIPESLGYLLKPGKVEPRGGDGKAAGFACDVAVTLYTPIRSAWQPSAEIAQVSFAVSATSDSGPEQGAAHP